MSGALALPWRVVAGAGPRPSGARGEQPVPVRVVSLLTSRLPVWAVVHGGACGTVVADGMFPYPGGGQALRLPRPRCPRRNCYAVAPPLCRTGPDNRGRGDGVLLSPPGELRAPAPARRRFRPALLPGPGAVLSRPGCG